MYVKSWQAGTLVAGVNLRLWNTVSHLKQIILCDSMDRYVPLQGTALDLSLQRQRRT